MPQRLKRQCTNYDRKNFIFSCHLLHTMMFLCCCLFIFCRSYVWAKCPKGFYLNGIRISGEINLHQIEEAKCCRPHNHPDDYQDCYEEDVTYSFDRKGWSECRRSDYYMTGFYRSDCDHLYCIEKFHCCRMKNGNLNTIVLKRHCPF